MDITLIYEVITAVTATSSGFAGARAAYLSREAGRSDVPIVRVALTGVQSDLSVMQRGVREAISEKCSGVQNAAAWLATSTALFGVASTRPAFELISIVFVLIGATLVVVAVQAILKASDAAKLPPARIAFQSWYLGKHESIEGGEHWTEEEIASAFTDANPECASTLRRFSIWPFPPMQIGHMRPPSDYPPGWRLTRY